MPHVKDGAYTDDPWRPLGEGETAPEAAPVLVPLARFLNAADTLLARGPVAVLVASGEDVNALGPHLDRIAAVVLDIPGFKDGRAYSSARTLRQRYRFKGEIRARGAFLIDQVGFLHRVGVDAFEGDGRITPEAVAREIARFADVYQPAADTLTPIGALRR